MFEVSCMQLHTKCELRKPLWISTITNNRLHSGMQLDGRNSESAPLKADRTIAMSDCCPLCKASHKAENVTVRKSAIPDGHSSLNSTDYGRPLCGMLLTKHFSDFVP